MSTQQESTVAGLDVAGVTTLIAQHFPADSDLGDFETLKVGGRAATVKLPYSERFARAGGTISGPTMFKLADFAAYAAILGELGAGAIEAVTTTLTINFLSRPQPGALFGHVRILRMGRRNVVCDVMVRDEDDKLVAQASCIYALPPEPAGTVT